MNAASSQVQSPQTVARTLERFSAWLENYGETSWDHQSYFAGPVGRWAKGVYYKHPKLGQMAVSPMIFSEAFLPSARRLFHHKIRFPIADAHYAMGFAYFHQATQNSAYLDRAIHFLEELKKSRSSGFNEYCWGYPFDWVTRTGIMSRQTPMITSTPYMFEAFVLVHTITRDDAWLEIAASIARHGANDIKDYPTSAKGSSCSYNPYGAGGVINAAAYRAGMLATAANIFGIDRYREIAERNLYFVLEHQNEDGSWYYAADGVRDFIDHFHTCFVMKGLAKVHSATGNPDCLKALQRGADYYQQNLFDADGMPKPFAKAPRLTVYKRELYDCAESINLCLILRDRIPQLESTLNAVVGGVLRDWTRASGSFRARKLHLGWDDVPMHRWGQSQMFASLALYLRETATST